MELDALPRSGGIRPARPTLPLKQRPYEERVVTWMLTREEVHRKRK